MPSDDRATVLQRTNSNEEESIGRSVARSTTDRDTARLEERLRERDALRRVGARADLVEQHERRAGRLRGRKERRWHTLFTFVFTGSSPASR